MEISVISFNVDCLSLNRQSEFSWENRKNNNKYFIDTVNNDIVCLQEACGENIEFFLVNQTKMDFYKGVGIINSEGIKIYNPIFWNDSFKMIKKGRFYLEEITEKSETIWDSCELRCVSWVLLMDIRDKSRFIIVNTHLDSKGSVARKEASKMIAEFIKQLSDQEYCPVILCGDFNSRPWFPADENQLEYGELIWPGYLPTDDCYNLFRKEGFTDSYLFFYDVDNLDSNTYHDYNGDIFPKVGLRIDWQLVWDENTKNIEVRSYNLYKEVIVSDHYPVLCKYNINSTVADCLYNGYNKVFLYCSQGYALKWISKFLEKKYEEDIELIKKRILKENFLKFTMGKKSVGYDYPTNNAIYQGGVIKEVEIAGNVFIKKCENTMKKNKRYIEMKNYLELKRIFPDKFFIGKLNEKDVYFKIIMPLNSDTMMEDGYLLMHKLDGRTLEEQIYSYCTTDYDLLEMYIRMIKVLLEYGFVCADMSPRNVIILETNKEIIFQLIDFEKSYFLSESQISINKQEILRGQICGEELAVLIDMNTIKSLFDYEYNPDEWDTSDTELLLTPYRPEVHDILTGRGYDNYTIGVYNAVEKEMLEVVEPNRNAKYEALRFPGRIKFKVSHYISCLSVGDGAEYERKVTELLIRSKASGKIYFNKLIIYLSKLIGELEEQILVDYSLHREFVESLKKAAYVMGVIDNFYLSDEELFLKMEVIH